MPKLRMLLALVLAVLVTEMLAAAAATQFVVHELAELGVAVPLLNRLAMTAHDIAGMLPLYGPIIGAAFLIALPIAGLLAARLPADRRLVFAAAGAAGVLAAIVIMRMLFEIMPIAGARSGAGLAAQAVAGGLGGALFAWLNRHGSGTGA